MSKFTKSPQLFNGIAWGVTLLIVAGLLGFAYWKVFPQQVSAASEHKPTPTRQGVTVLLPTSISLDPTSFQAIVRQIVLKTDISSSTTYTAAEYTVESGDSVFGIAKAHSIKPETLLWSNYDVLQDSPDSIRVGQQLYIPPTDGVYYKWLDGDTLGSVAAKFSAKVEDILNWPGNDIDLTNPVVKPDTFVMIPGGHREFVQWIVPTVARGRSGTANVGGTACGSGPVGGLNFIWPVPQHWISGNDFWSGHLGIDIAASFGDPVSASEAGVVTMAQGGLNYGYGNVVMIDHGNGYITLYGHLSQINVTVCQGVAQSQLIGLAGSTGNSTGPHLHFEVRLNGNFVNPHYVLPNP